MPTSAAVRNLRAAYLAENPRCELTAAMGVYLPRLEYVPGVPAVHHILGRGKWLEIIENYATVNPALHRWLHNTGNRHVATVCLFWWKWRRSEFEPVWPESGKRPLGLVEAELMRDRLPAWCRKLGEELVNNH